MPAMETSARLKNLSRQTIKEAPEYTNDSLVTRDYEIGLHGHYNRKGYWIDDLVNSFLFYSPPMRFAGTSAGTCRKLV
jgi:hypothetical protein